MMLQISGAGDSIRNDTHTLDLDFVNAWRGLDKSKSREQILFGVLNYVEHEDFNRPIGNIAMWMCAI